MTVDENGGLAWWCKNCALEWPENFCAACGRHLTVSDLTNGKQATAASEAVSASPLAAVTEEHR